MRLRRRPWTDREGVGVHLQVFLALRDAQRRVAAVRLEGPQPDAWTLPSENVFDGAAPDAVVAGLVPRWFRTPLAPRVAQLQNYPPEDGDRHWMVVAVYEADAPPGLQPTPDTRELRFFPPGAPPGPMFKDHASVWRRLPP